MSIREILDADIPAVIALWEVCGLTRPWNDPRIDIALARNNPTSTVLVADHAGAIRGAALVGYEGHRAWVYYLAVAPKAQREGLGRDLMDAAEIWARAHDAPKIQLMVRQANIAAMGFYERLGYVRDDTVVWGKRLDGQIRPEPVQAETATVVSVSRSADHRFSKPAVNEIYLLAGLGVEGDAHAGVTVKHRSRVAKDPTQPNLRQVHLIPAELHAALRVGGFRIAPGAMGENVTTQGLDLLALPRGARLKLGPVAVVEITGLRNPCAQLNAYQPGLMAAVLDCAADGALIRKAGVMGVVLTSGAVRPGDTIEVELAAGLHEPLGPV